MARMLLFALAVPRWTPFLCALALASGAITRPALAAPIPAVATSEAAPPYRPVGGGRFELTRDVRFETSAFGPVVLTRGYRSNGSSSPIRDTHRSRMAGFLHDALYAASGHLRFPAGMRTGWTKRDADGAYCGQLRRLGVSSFHRRTNCAGARRLAGGAWKRLAPKRARRWSQWSRAR